MRPELIKEKLDKILKFIGVKPKIEIKEEEGTYKVFIEGKDLSFLIGYRGETLNSLQNILGLMLFKEAGEWHPIVVDINGYREQKVEKIEDITRNYIDRVRFHGEEVEMSPMNPYERRQVHIMVSEYPDIESESTGQGRDRRVVLRPVRK